MGFRSHQEFMRAADTVTEMPIKSLVVSYSISNEKPK